MSGEKVIVFTDLDGTLLDLNTYSYREAQEALELIKVKGVPLIFCSSKTRAEQEFYRDELGIIDPFIVESGGAIFIRRGYFKLPYRYHRSCNDYDVIEIGRPYTEIRRALERVRVKTQIAFKGYGDMTVDEVASETGLDPEAARRAMMREYEETVELELPQTELERFRRALSREGLKCTFGGRFYSITGPNDKGKAVAILADLYRRELGSICTIGLGDSLNDVPLFLAVDLPILLQRPGGVWEDIDLPNLWKVEGVGPVGWNRAIVSLLK